MDKIKTLKDLLEYSAVKYGNKDLYKVNDTAITYSDFYNYVRAISSALINLKISNQRIGIISENRFEWEMAFFAISCSNNIIVPIDKSYTKIEIKNVINKASVSTVFTSNNYKGILNEIKNEADNSLNNIICFDNDDRENSIFNLLKLGMDESNFFENLYDNDSINIDSNIKESKNLDSNNNLDNNNNSFSDTKKFVNENDLCLISFTSGTTDNPKAVMLSHKNICSNLISVSKRINLSESDICLSILPLNHVLEGLFCFLLSFYRGCARIFCNGIENICDYIKKYKITFMGGVPAIYNYLLKKKDELINEANHINMFMCGGAPLNSNIITDFNEIGITLIQGYGLTECAPVVSIENKDNKKLGSVGKPISNVNVDIIDKNEEGTGEIIVKGDNVFLGYLNDVDNTKKQIKDNWFYTGDLGRIDEDGYIYICGRKKNMIVLPNGKKVFPDEIELLINRIEDVKESLVFENESTNKINAVIVTSSDNEKSIREKIDIINQSLPIYKNINDIIVTSTELNKTPTGKIIRDYRNIEVMKNNNFNDSVFNKLESIIINQFGNKQISYATDLRKDLGADSLDKLELFLNIENAFNVNLTHEQKKKINTVGDIMKIVNKIFSD